MSALFISDWEAKMKRKILTLGVLALSACVTDSKLPSSTQLPSEDVSSIARPDPIARPDTIVSQQQFLNLFADLCLVSPRKLSYFRSTANRFGLVQTRMPGFAGTEEYAWGKPDERQRSALSFRVGSLPILYEISGDPSGFPSRRRRCSVSAYLAKNDIEAQRAIEARVRENFQPRANALDFSSYSNSYEVTSEDISIDLSLSQRTTYVDMRPNSSCPQDNPCWYRTPYELSLIVIIERIP